MAEQPPPSAARCWLRLVSDGTYAHYEVSRDGTTWAPLPNPSLIAPWPTGAYVLLRWEDS